MYFNFYKLSIIILIIIIFILLFSNSNVLMFISSRVYTFGVNKINYRILNHVEKYNHREGVYTNIYYTDGDIDYINLVMSAVDTYYPFLLNDFGLKDYSKVTVIIYPSTEKMYSALGLDIKEMSMGIYYGEILNLLSPSLWTKGNYEAEIKDEFLKDGPLIHELTHLVLDNKTKGNYPLWFTEGVALYYEYKYTGFEWRSDLREKSKAVKLGSLVDNFRYLDEALAYRRCFDIINHLVSKQGEEKLQELIKQMSIGKSFDYAFSYVYKHSIEIIDSF